MANLSDGSAVRRRVGGAAVRSSPAARSGRAAAAACRFPCTPGTGSHARRRASRRGRSRRRRTGAVDRAAAPALDDHRVTRLVEAHRDHPQQLVVLRQPGEEAGHRVGAAERSPPVVSSTGAYHSIAGSKIVRTAGGRRGRRVRRRRARGRCRWSCGPAGEAAALVHDLGRVAVSDTVRDEPGPLTRDERDRARCTRRSPASSCRGARSPPPWPDVACAVHERLDGLAAAGPRGAARPRVPAGPGWLINHLQQGSRRRARTPTLAI